MSSDSKFCPVHQARPYPGCDTCFEWRTWAIVQLRILAGCPEHAQRRNIDKCTACDTLYQRWRRYAAAMAKLQNKTTPLPKVEKEKKKTNAEARSWDTCKRVLIKALEKLHAAVGERECIKRAKLITGDIKGQAARSLLHQEVERRPKEVVECAEWATTLAKNIQPPPRKKACVRTAREGSSTSTPQST